MKRIIYLLILISAPALSYSQGKNLVWIFGDSAGINFSNINNPLPVTSGMDGRGSSASISDSNSNLLFYSYTRAGAGDWSTFVMNEQHVKMPNGDSITGAAWYNEFAIIPRDSNRFYLFSYGSDDPNNEGLYYSIVDMNLNGGLGAVTKKDSQLNPNRIGDCLTAVKHGNGRDWWVICKLSDPNGTNHNRFFKYLITTDTIIGYPFQDFNDARDADFQKIIWHQSNDKFMLINDGGYMSEFNFDRCSGNIAFIRNIFPEQTSNFNRLFWEGAYSPNGNIFYVTTDFWFGVDSVYLLQLDLNSTNISANIDTLDIAEAPIATGAVRLAPDNKIYFTRWYLCNIFPYCYPYPDSVRNIYNENLSLINSPDSLGAACNYQPYSFYLGGKRTYAGLPNNPNYDLGPLVGSICDSLTIGIEETTKKNVLGNLFPNPANKNVTMLLNQPLPASGILRVYDSIGIKKTEVRLEKNAASYNINSSGYPPGIYTLSIEGNTFLLKLPRLVISH